MSSTVEKRSTRSNEGKIVIEQTTCGGERDTKVSLGERRNRSSKEGSKFLSSGGVNANEEKSGLVVVNGETSGELKVLQDMLWLRMASRELRRNITV